MARVLVMAERTCGGSADPFCHSFTELLFELRVDEVFVREGAIPLFLGHHLLFFNDELVQRLAGEEAFAGDVGAGLVAEVRLQERHDAERTHHEVLATVGVDDDAVDALFTHRDAGVGHDLHLHVEGERDDRFHDVQFELAGGGGEHDRRVETDREERGLVGHFRDDGVDLARHDRGTRLELRQDEFGETRTRTGGKEAEVVADLRQLDGKALDGGREGDVGAAVRRGGDEVVAVLEVDAGDFSEVLDGEGRVFRMSRHGRADGGGAEVDDLEVFLRFLE